MAKYVVQIKNLYPGNKEMAKHQRFRAYGAPGSKARAKETYIAMQSPKMKEVYAVRVKKVKIIKV